MTGTTHRVRRYTRLGLLGLLAALQLLGRDASAQGGATEPGSPKDAAPEDAAPLPPLRPAGSAPPAPQLTILSIQPATDGAVVVEVEVVAPDGAPVQLVPSLNGAPVQSFALSRARGLAIGNRYTLTMKPRQRDGVLSVIARSGERVSLPAEVRLRQGAEEKRPALYVLSVGVGRYRSSEIAQLRFPPKDALDLASTLRGQRDLLYREVISRVLLDADASRAGVLAGMDWLADKVGKNDTAVIFLAGHGTNDTDGTYFYLPADAQADKATLISGGELSEALRRIRGRVVLMLDTCHSGSVLGRRSLTRLINELTTENRIVVFAASAGDQAARESPAWRNGAFTKAVIEGLRGLADYADDGKISMSELETWAGVRVPQLTSGVQTPTLAKPNATPDYVLAALPLVGVLPNPKQRLRQRSLLIGLGVVAGALTIGIGITVGVIGNQRDANDLGILNFH